MCSRPPRPPPTRADREAIRQQEKQPGRTPKPGDKKKEAARKKAAPPKTAAARKRAAPKKKAARKKSAARVKSKPAGGSSSDKSKPRGSVDRAA